LVGFDAAEFELQGDDDGIRRWRAPSGGMVGLYWFALPPDIVADLRSITAVRNVYRKIVTKSGAAIIEVETPEIAGCLTTWLIIKVPQNRCQGYLCPYCKAVTTSARAEQTLLGRVCLYTRCCF
jgi:hypothetical protein